MDLSPENIEHLVRGILWLTGTATGAYLCFKEYGHEQRPLLTFLGIVCLLGAIFNVFVILNALSHIF